MSGIPALGGLKKPAASVSKIKPPAGIQPPGSLSGKTGTPGTLSTASSASNLASETESGTKLGGQALKDPSDILTHDPDDFIIGDRVWVNGTKPGYIQFIGETNFATGDWAGIVLDEPIGKNDGSVSGVRYFQCEPRRGVFARLQRLTRYPMSGHNGANDSTLMQEAPGKSITTRTVVRPCSPGAVGRVTPTSPPRAVITNTESVAVDHGLRIGDRVIVNASSGFKNGTLRFIGATEFAQGHWCGVELDEPVGKNDGSVNGKRYFACRSKYGLFAPVHKVAREGGHTTTTVHTTTRTTKVTSPPRMVTRTGSRESIASNVSSTSSHSIRRSKPRLGVTSLAAGERHSGQQSQQQGQSTNKALSSILSPNQGVLQDALREKEEHIEQLLKERDLEQTEIARVTAQMEETEAKLDVLRAEYAKATEAFAEERDALKKQVKQTERECDELNRKIEDLQFALEEIEINKADADQERRNLLEKVADLEKMLQSGADAKSPEGQANLKLVEIEAKHRKEIDEYKRRLEDSHGEIKAFKDSVDVEKRAHKEVEKLISTKDAQLKACDAELVKNKKACEELRGRVEQLENELFEMAERSQEVKGEEIEELRNKLKDGEKKLIEERQSLLKTQKERTDLLAQCDIFERQIKDIQKQNDSYREELTKLSEQGGQLTTKLEGEIEVLKKKLKDTEASLNRERDTKAELLDKKDNLEFRVEETSSKLEELEKNLKSSKTYVEQLEDEKRALKAKVESLVREASEKEFRALSSEKTSDGLLQEKIAEAERYRAQISERDDKISQLSRSLSESQQEVTSLGNELDSIRSKLDSERRNSETALKKAEHECQSMRFELENTSESLKTELDNLKKLYDQSLKDADMSRKKLKTNEEERNDLQAKISKLVCDLENARSSKDATFDEMSDLRKEISDLKLKVCEVDNAKSAAIRDCEREREKCRSLEQKITNSEAMMSREQGDAKRQIEDLEERLTKAQNLNRTQNEEYLSKTRQSTNEINELRDCVKNLKGSLSDLERQISEARRNDESLRSANDRLKNELDSLNRMIASGDSERERQMERILDEKRSAENKLQAELDQALSETDRLRRVLDDERNRLEDLKTEFDIKSDKLSRAEELIRKNEVERKEQVLSFKSQMENLRGEFDRYRRTLEENLEETKLTSSHIEGQREVVEELHRQLTLKEVEAQQKGSEVSTLLLRIEDLERRNQNHVQEISRLESLSRGSRPRSKSPTGGDGDEKRAVDEKDSQIDFLNSIIVDMQRKNDEYRARIQILETNPTDFKAASGPLTKNGKVKTVRPPRLFCDICEVFDRHDTDDCPQQASEVVDHSKHQGSRGPSNRPYCSNCETFGHEASQCEIEEF